MKELIKEALHQFTSMQEDNEKVEIIRARLGGKQIAINEILKTGGNSGYEYQLTDFTFKIGWISGSGGKKIANNIYIVNSKDLHDRWEIVKFYFSDIEIIGGSIEYRKNSKYPFKKLLSISSNETPTLNFIKIFKKLIILILEKMICKELSIPLADLTVNLRNIRVAPQFLKSNNSVQEIVANKLKKYFVGKQFFNQGIFGNERSNIFYKIVGVKVTSANSYALLVRYNRNAFENTPFLTHKSIEMYEIKDMGLKYFGIPNLKIG